jgi:hypothetical protein
MARATLSARWKRDCEMAAFVSYVSLHCMATGYAPGGRESVHWAKQRKSEVKESHHDLQKGPLSAIVFRQEKSVDCARAEDESRILCSWAAGSALDEFLVQFTCERGHLFHVKGLVAGKKK